MRHLMLEMIEGGTGRIASVHRLFSFTRRRRHEADESLYNNEGGLRTYSGDTKSKSRYHISICVHIDMYEPKVVCNRSLVWPSRRGRW